ncbi:MAG: hyaluronan synthase [Candidatus Binatota bacterium]|nr:hyaluronan synthase [Candidatus Binatota bacterium]
MKISVGDPLEEGSGTAPGSSEPRLALLAAALSRPAPEPPVILEVVRFPSHRGPSLGIPAVDVEVAARLKRAIESIVRPIDAPETVTDSPRARIVPTAGEAAFVLRPDDRIDAPVLRSRATVELLDLGLFLESSATTDGDPAFPPMSLHPVAPELPDHSPVASVEALQLDAARAAQALADVTTEMPLWAQERIDALSEPRRRTRGFDIGAESERLELWLARTCALLIFVLCMANIFVLRWLNFTYYWYRPLLNAYSIGVAGFILSRFVIALFYRPPREQGVEPHVSVVITAFNEEDAIYRTIECCYAVEYPREKLEVIAVDDGSTDRTMDELYRAKQRWPDLVIESYGCNKGKREAMAVGARVAHGDVLVYVDSDSFLRRDAVRKIVRGFADPHVAAVAGHTEVANVYKNLLTRMQQARYYVAFRVMKAAESAFGAVTCCPGCFSAYRKSCVLDVLDPWLNQRFLGVPATFGDDRSLTNFLLRNYEVIYDSEAIATTIVPEHHGKFLKQQLRWKKSWLRECMIAGTFMWKKHPIAAVSFYAQLVFPVIAPILMLRAFVWLPLVNGDFLSMFIYTFGVMLIGLIFAAYYLFWKADSNWLYGVYFTGYYMFVLVWQMPYAIATSRDNRWGTR